MPIDDVPECNKDKIPGVRTTMVDVTERKRAEERIRALNQQIIEAQEIERKRLSWDLHDNLAQDLSASKMICDTLFDNDIAPPAKIRRKVETLSKMLQKSISQVRDLAHELCPSTLDRLGVSTTVRHYCEEFSKKHDLTLDFFSFGMDNVKLGLDTKIILYRLVQEGLNNIAKHADASNVTVTLGASFPHIILRIEDNGKGFDVEKRLKAVVQEKRMGIRTIEQRVAFLNGTMSIESFPNQGTKVLIEVPYDA